MRRKNIEPAMKNNFKVLAGTFGEGNFFCLFVLLFYFLLFPFGIFSLVVLIIIDGEVRRCSDVLCVDFQSTKLKRVPVVWCSLMIHNTNCFITCCSIFRYLHGKEPNCFGQTAVQGAYG